MTIGLSEVGAFPRLDAIGGFAVRFGVYLPGVQAADNFEVIARFIHVEDLFNPDVHTKDVPLTYLGGPLDSWAANVALQPDTSSNFGQEGVYVYR